MHNSSEAPVVVLLAAPSEPAPVLRPPPDPGTYPVPLAWAVRFLPEYFVETPCAFHVELFDTLARPDARLVARIAPRGHAKSTCAGFAYPLWCICEQRRRNIVIVSQAAPLAVQFVRDIREELEANDDIRDAYGELCPGAAEPRDAATRTDGRGNSSAPTAATAAAPARRRGVRPRWSAGLFTTTTGITIQAKGSGAAFRGLRVGPRRPDLVICDDIEKDVQVASAAGRRKLEAWLRKVVLPALAPDGQLVVLGSLLHSDSLLAHLGDPQRFPHWDYRVHRALEAEPLPDGTLRKVALWPARWPVERLELERERVGTTAFEQEYQANPIDATQQIFRAEWFRKYRPSELPHERLVHLMAVDPATGKENGDFFALWVGSVDTTRRTIYTRELTLERIGATTQIERVIAAFRKWQPLRVGIETVGYQHALKQMLDERSLQLGLYMPITGINTRANKQARIQSLAPFVENGLFRFPEDLDPEVERQFLLFPEAGHDDAPDVCVMGLDLAREFAAGLRVESVVAPRANARDRW